MDHRGLIARLRSHWRAVLVVHLFFALLGIALLTPLFSVILRALLGFPARPR